MFTEEGEPVEDNKSTDSVHPPIHNHYYMFPNGNSNTINMVVGADGRMYVGGAPTDQPPSPELETPQGESPPPGYSLQAPDPGSPHVVVNTISHSNPNSPYHTTV